MRQRDVSDLGEGGKGGDKPEISFPCIGRVEIERLVARHTLVLLPHLALPY